MYNWSEISNYLNGEMDKEQKIIFEANIKLNPKLKKQVDLMNSDLLLIEKYKNNSLFDTDKAWQKVEKKAFKKTINIKVLFSIAASVIFILGCIMFFYNDLNYKNKIYVETLFKQEKTIILPDGSSVLMNANTTISYPKHFSENERRISFSGEAFFQIKKNKHKKFIVQMKNTEVMVLGTSFNLKTKKNIVELLVATGKVKLKYLNTNNNIILQKGEFAVAKNNKLKKEDISDINYMSWKTKKIIFNKQKLRNVIEQIEEIYHVNISMKEDLYKNKSWTAIFENEALDIVLKSLCSSFDYKYRRTKDEIIIEK